MKFADGLDMVYAGKRGSKRDPGKPVGRRLDGSGGWTMSNWRCRRKRRAEGSGRQTEVQVRSPGAAES